ARRSRTWRPGPWREGGYGGLSRGDAAVHDLDRQVDRGQREQAAHVAARVEQRDAALAAADGSPVCAQDRLQAARVDEAQLGEVQGHDRTVLALRRGQAL